MATTLHKIYKIDRSMQLFSVHKVLVSYATLFSFRADTPPRKQRQISPDKTRTNWPHAYN